MGHQARSGGHSVFVGYFAHRSGGTQTRRGDSQLAPVGWAVKLHRAANDVRGNLFVKKILRFLRPISEIDEAERLRFVSRLDKDEGFRKDVEDNLLLLLDRLDDMGKPELVGRLFTAYLKEDLTYEDFVRLSGDVDRAYLSDLPAAEGSYRRSSAAATIQTSATDDRVGRD